ncbi:MAG: hypothetical protein ACRDIV_24175 [Ktedonobacteraceae bacterium]
MPTLQDIQGWVDDALAHIANRAYVQSTPWPRIKEMLPDCTELEEFHRMQMRMLIYERLNKQPLHGAPVPINLQRLQGDLQAGGVQAIEPAAAYIWLAW